MKTSSPATPSVGQPVRHGRKQGLLGFLAAPGLREDLDHHHIRRPLEAKPGILGDDLARGMLRDDMEVVPLRNAIFGQDGVMDSPAESLRVLRGCGPR